MRKWENTIKFEANVFRSEMCLHAFANVDPIRANIMNNCLMFIVCDFRIRIQYGFVTVQSIRWPVTRTHTNTECFVRCQCPDGTAARPLTWIFRCVYSVCAVFLIRFNLLLLVALKFFAFSLNPHVIFRLSNINLRISTKCKHAWTIITNFLIVWRSRSSLYATHTRTGGK